MIDINSFTILIPIVALIIAIFSISITTIITIIIRKSALNTEFIQQANFINDSFLKYSIKSPYYQFLEKKLNKDNKTDNSINFKDTKENKTLLGITAIFLHHINLIGLLYKNRGLLGIIKNDDLQIWIKKVFKPWIESDKRFALLWGEFKEREGLYKDKKFIDYIEKNLKD